MLLPSVGASNPVLGRSGFGSLSAPNIPALCTCWLDTRHLNDNAAHLWPIAGTALASAWLEDIIRYQVHKFLAGIAPIRSLCKVSSAAMQLVAIPVEHLFAESSGELPCVLSIQYTMRQQP